MNYTFRVGDLVRVRNKPTLYAGKEGRVITTDAHGCGVDGILKTRPLFFGYNNLELASNSPVSLLPPSSIQLTELPGISELTSAINSLKEIIDQKFSVGLAVTPAPPTPDSVITRIPIGTAVVINKDFYREDDCDEHIGKYGTVITQLISRNEHDRYEVQIMFATNRINIVVVTREELYIL